VPLAFEPIEIKIILLPFLISLEKASINLSGGTCDVVGRFFRLP